MVRKQLSKLLFLMILAVVLAVPLVFAYDTEITVSTMANHDVEITVMDPYADEAGSNLLERFTENSEETGEVSVIYSSSKSKINVVVMLSRDGKSVRIDDKSIHKFEEHTAGTPLSIILIPGQTTETIETETEESQENDTQEETNRTLAEENEPEGETNETPAEENEPKITGAAIDGEKSEGSFPSKILYIIGGIFFALIVIFFVLKMTVLKEPLGPRNIKVTKYSDMKKEESKGKEEEGKKEAEEYEDKKEDIEDKDLSAAEKRLKQAQAEIEKFKKMREVEEKIKKTEEELERLRSGGD